MYVVDITRCHDELGSDIVVGKNSMDAKSKIISYVKDYTFANYNIYLNEDVLDRGINLDGFSFKEFMKNNYNINVHNEVIIHGFHTDKDNSLFVKFFDDDTKEFPLMYVLGNNEKDKAHFLMTYLVNDALINKYQDDIPSYERFKLQYNNKDINSFSHNNIKCETISLYNGGFLLEELLNNVTSLKKIKGQDFGGIRL